MNNKYQGLSTTLNWVDVSEDIYNNLDEDNRRIIALPIEGKEDASSSTDKELTPMQQLINECIKARDYLKGIEEDYELGQVAAYDVVIEAATSLLEAERKMVVDTYTAAISTSTNGWVKVEEGLPENNETVDVAAMYGKKIMVCSDTAYCNEGKWFDHSNDFQLVDGFIKYWKKRPLPPNH